MPKKTKAIEIDLTDGLTSCGTLAEMRDYLSKVEAEWGDGVVDAESRWGEDGTGYTFSLTITREETEIEMLEREVAEAEAELRRRERETQRFEETKAYYFQLKRIFEPAAE